MADEPARTGMRPTERLLPPTFTLYGVLVEVLVPAAQTISHPVVFSPLEMVPPGPCVNPWRTFAMNGQPMPGYGTEPCKHNRMYVSPEMPVGFLVRYLQHRQQVQFAEGRAALREAVAAAGAPSEVQDASRGEDVSDNGSMD